MIIYGRQAQEEKHVEPVKPAKAVKTEGEIRRENNKKITEA